VRKQQLNREEHPKNATKFISQWEKRKYELCTYSGGDPAGGDEDADHDDKEEEENGRRHRRRRRGARAFIAPSPAVRDHSHSRRSHRPLVQRFALRDLGPAGVPSFSPSASGSGPPGGARKSPGDVRSAPITQEGASTVHVLLLCRGLCMQMMI